jgi:hypothetical protein
MASDDKISNIEALWEATKKFPNRLVGGPVDVANIVAGGLDNLRLAALGQEITRSVGDGLTPKPVGGSDWLNEKTGLSNDRSGKEDLIGAVMDTLVPSPGGAAKALIGAAVTIKTVDEGRKFMSLEQAGASPGRLFQETGIYRGPGDAIPRTVISDEGVTLIKDSPKLRHTNNLKYLLTSPSLTDTYAVQVGKDVKLKDILHHPILYKYYPEAQEIDILPDIFNPGKAAYFNNTIQIGSSIGQTKYTNPRGIPLKADRQMTSVLLHEVQHWIQQYEGFVGGANVNAFITNPNTIEKHSKKLMDALRSTVKEFNKKYPDKSGWGNITPESRADPLFGRMKRLEQMVGQLELKKKIAFDQYLGTAGEAEARAVQAMYERQTGPVFPLLHYDVPIDQLNRGPFTPRIQVPDTRVQDPMIINARTNTRQYSSGNK